MVIIATHVVILNNRDVYGPPHAVALYLRKKHIDHVVIKHPLYGNAQTQVEYFRDNKQHILFYGKKAKYSFGMRYIYEFCITVYICFRERRDLRVFIGVDPLNACAGIVVKQLRLSKRTIFFCADYAIERFGNPLLNAFYQLLDVVSMRFSDEVWSVSKRIVGYRKKKGLEKCKNKLLPNAPFFEDVKRKPLSSIHPHTIVIVSALEKGVAFGLLIDVIGKLRKKVRDVKLIIIGSGSLEKSLKQKVSQNHLGRCVTFLGAMSHDKMFSILTKCGVGVALYNYSDTKSFHFFSDSMKVRDYAASGLPIVISGNSGICEDIEKEGAGIHVDITEDSLYNALYMLIKNKSIYRKYRNNAISFARKYDTFAILDTYINKYL